MADKLELSKEFKKAIDDLEVCDKYDLRAIVDSTNISREDLVRGIMEAPEDEHKDFIVALKRDGPIYGAMKSELDNWNNLDKQAKTFALKKAYDILIQ